MSKLHGNLFALVLGIVGAILGAFVFVLLIRQGFYGLAIPGAIMGLLASFGRPTSPVIGIVVGVLALGLGLYLEWDNRPFVADDSLGYFLTHVHELQPFTFIMLLLGTVLAFWPPFSAARR